MTSSFEQNEGTYQPGLGRFFYEMKCKVVCHDRPLGKGTDGFPTNLQAQFCSSDPIFVIE